ncbi:MAG: hypothetical protein ABFS14_10520 [Gemmatimonadota bacterium]
MKKRMGTLLAVMFLAGCGSDTTDPLAQFEPQISNSADNFQLQASNVENVGSTLNYTWENTGSQASVDHSTTLTAGAARVIVKDADGTIVYDADLLPSKNEQTAVGSSGTWTISLVLTNYSGTLNFRVQKQ